MDRQLDDVVGRRAQALLLFLVDGNAVGVDLHRQAGEGPCVVHLAHAEDRDRLQQRSDTGADDLLTDLRGVLPGEDRVKSSGAALGEHLGDGSCEDVVGLVDEQRRATWIAISTILPRLDLPMQQLQQQLLTRIALSSPTADLAPATMRISPRSMIPVRSRACGWRRTVTDNDAAPISTRGAPRQGRSEEAARGARPGSATRTRGAPIGLFWPSRLLSLSRSSGAVGVRRNQRAGATARPAPAAALLRSRSQVTRIVSLGPSARALARCTAS